MNLKKSHLYTILLLTLLSSDFTLGGNTDENAPWKIRLKVVENTKISFFYLGRTLRGETVKFSSNRGASNNADLSNPNYNYIVRKVEALGPEASTKRSCSKSYIEVTSRTGKKEANWTGCIFGQDELSIKITKLISDLKRQFY